MQILMIVCSIISVIMSLIAISLALVAVIEMRAMKNSTHRIEWRAVEDPFQNKTEDLEEFNEDPLEGV